MKDIGDKYIDINPHLAQVEKEMNEKSSKLMSKKYKESIERICDLYDEVKETNNYLKTLENLIEMEKELQCKIYTKMVSVAGWK